MARWIDIALAFQIASQLGWHVRYGTFFTTAETDVSIRPVIWLAATVAVLYSGLQLIASWDRVRPSPNLGRPAVPV